MARMIRSVAAATVAAVTGRACRSARSTGGPKRIWMRVRRGEIRGTLVYGASSSCGPHCAIGMTGQPDCRASRAAPVLPRIGHCSGSRVSEPSG